MLCRQWKCCDFPISECFVSASRTLRAASAWGSAGFVLLSPGILLSMGGGLLRSAFCDILVPTHQHLVEARWCSWLLPGKSSVPKAQHQLLSDCTHGMLPGICRHLLLHQFLPLLRVLSSVLELWTTPATHLPRHVAVRSPNSTQPCTPHWLLVCLWKLLSSEMMCFQMPFPSIKKKGGWGGGGEETVFFPFPPPFFPPGSSQQVSLRTIAAGEV